MKSSNNQGRWIYFNKVWEDRSYAKEEKQGEMTDKERGENKNKEETTTI